MCPCLPASPPSDPDVPLPCHPLSSFQRQHCNVSSGTSTTFPVPPSHSIPIVATVCSVPFPTSPMLAISSILSISFRCRLCGAIFFHHLQQRRCVRQVAQLCRPSNPTFSSPLRWPAPLGSSARGVVGSVGLPALPSLALLRVGFLNLGGLVEVFHPGDFTLLLFAICGVQRRPSMPLQQWGDRNSKQAYPMVQQGHTQVDPDLIVIQQKLYRGYWQHLRRPAIVCFPTVYPILGLRTPQQHPPRNPSFFTIWAYLPYQIDQFVHTYLTKFIDI